MHTPFMDKSPHHRRDSAGGRLNLKQRLAQILTRSSCTTNTTSAATANPATAFVSLSRSGGADSHHHHQEAPPSPYFCTPCTYERPKVDGRRRTRSASLVHISVDCTGVTASGRRSVQSDAPPLLQHLSVPARDVIKKQSKDRGKPPARSPSASRRHLLSSSSSSWGRARRPTRSTTAAAYSWSSSSSTATDDEVAPYSSSSDGEEEAETRTLFSSLSFSSDSSEFYRHNTTRNTSLHRRRRTTARRHAPRRAPLPRPTGEAAPPPPLADAFRPLVSVETTRKQHRECSNESKKLMTTMGAAAAAAEEAGGAGMAVVKRSSNPYLDFRSSMVEMVVERRIGSVGQMEELLGSYLSLNSPRHHPAILAAFEDVWEAVFGVE